MRASLAREPVIHLYILIDEYIVTLEVTLKVWLLYYPAFVLPVYAPNLLQVGADGRAAIRLV